MIDGLTAATTRPTKIKSVIAISLRPSTLFLQNVDTRYPVAPVRRTHASPSRDQTSNATPPSALVPALPSTPPPHRHVVRSATGLRTARAEPRCENEKQCLLIRFRCPPPSHPHPRNRATISHLFNFIRRAAPVVTSHDTSSPLGAAAAICLRKLFRQRRTEMLSVRPSANLIINNGSRSNFNPDAAASYSR